MNDAAPTSQLANAIRALAMDAVEAAKSGHPGMPMGMAEIAVALWNRHLSHNPANPKWPNRDRFVISNGHGSMLLYALLHLTGYDLPIDELKRFRQLHSKTPRTSGARPDARRRNDHGPAGTRARQCGRHGARRTAARRGIQPARPCDRRPSHLCLLRRRLPDGGHFARGGLARGLPRPGQADGALRRQRHLDRRRDEGLVHRRHAGQVRGLWLERDPPRRRPRHRRGRPRDPRRAARHRPAHAHSAARPSSAAVRRTSRERPRRTAPRWAKRKSR